MATQPTTAPVSPELLYLLHGDPAELAQACGPRPADIAEALPATWTVEQALWLVFLSSCPQ